MTSDVSSIICGNCGKKGHKYRECTNPITSYGIICLNGLDQELKVLMICRKVTIGYIELIRGNYKLEDVDYIQTLIGLMTTAEKHRLKDNLNNFDFIWIKLWSLDNQNVDRRKIESEYPRAKQRFERLREKYDLGSMIECSPDTYQFPEWGFPKGRRNMREKDEDCARREFEEETGFSRGDYELLNVKPICEDHIGCNGLAYRHIYLIAHSRRMDVEVGLNAHQAVEISDVRWVTLAEGIDLIRDYHHERKKLLQNLPELIKGGIQFSTKVEN